ncbi:hypothetical protein BASA81_016656 [Batrachochytrium salamandrivorans]|nr:hypothetical protein BASA81_016656 [Batrachochytrium salamandrivorans]
MIDRKLEFNWKGPYHVVDVGHPGTYWIMTPQGLRLPNAVNQADLAPWLAPVIDNVDFFYDGTNRNSSLDSSLLSSGLLLVFWSSAILGCSSTIPLGQQLPSAFNIKHDPEPPESPDIMTNLEEIVASLTDRLRSLEIENQALQQGTRPDSLREPKAALPDKFDGSRRHFRGFINQLELVFQLQDKRYDTDRKKIATLGASIRDQAPGTQTGNQPCAIYAAEFRQLTADIDWNDAALRSQFYSGLSSEIKDHLVHCESPVSLAAAMDQAIRIDNRIFERRQEQQYNSRPLRRNPLPNQPIPHIHSQQYQQQYVDNFHRQQIQQPSTSITATPVQQRPTSNDMDIDFARRGPLTSSERQQRFSQGLCLVCGQSGHLKATCPKSNPRFKPQRQVQAIEMEGHSSEFSGNDLGRL